MNVMPVKIAAETQYHESASIFSSYPNISPLPHYTLRGRHAISATGHPCFRQGTVPWRVAFHLVWSKYDLMACIITGTKALSPCSMHCAPGFNDYLDQKGWLCHSLLLDHASRLDARMYLDPCHLYQTIKRDCSCLHLSASRSSRRANSFRSTISGSLYPSRDSP